jgi:hypothetical protein
MVNQYKVKLRTLFEFLVQQEHFMAEYNGYDLIPFYLFQVGHLFGRNFIRAETPEAIIYYVGLTNQRIAALFFESNSRASRVNAFRAHTSNTGHEGFEHSPAAPQEHGKLTKKGGDFDEKIYLQYNWAIGAVFDMCYARARGWNGRLSRFWRQPGVFWRLSRLGRQPGVWWLSRVQRLSGIWRLSRVWRLSWVWRLSRVQRQPWAWKFV